MFHRLLNIPKSQSFFLFGPRGTGKSSLLKTHFSPQNSEYIDLLEDRQLSPLALDPDLLLDRVRALPAQKKWVVVDEVQKLPKLLDSVHALIESTDKCFALSGSSSRKLKAGGANLLAGRAFERHLFPLTYEEITNHQGFQLDEILRFGSLPKIFSLESDADKDDFLFAYGNTYLKEEVWAEQLVRNLDPFRKFLVAAAQSDGKIINFSKFSRQVGVDPKTIQSYFEILQDTLIGTLIDSFDTSIRGRIRKQPKFYFFDTGVSRALANHLPMKPQPQTSYYGDLFESWLINEWIRHSTYHRKSYQFSYYGDHANRNVDLVIERPGKNLAVVEIKSTKKLLSDHFKSLQAVIPLFQDADFYLVSQDNVPLKTKDGVHCLHWSEALEVI